jgi:hypothetical protein
MASGDIFANYGTRDLFWGSGSPQAFTERMSGIVGGLPLGRTGIGTSTATTAGGDVYYCTLRIPVNGTPLTTGTTTQLIWTDDASASGATKVAVVGVSMALITSGTTDYNAITWGTETATSLTAPSTATIVTMTASAVTKANMGTPAAGNLVAVRIRRLPNNASDTHPGRVLLLGLSIQDT